MVQKVVQEGIALELNRSLRVLNMYGFPTAILDQIMNAEDLVADGNTHGMFVGENHAQDKETIKATFLSCYTLSIKSCGDRRILSIQNNYSNYTPKTNGRQPA
jgi:hypothetical protein